tara:strand:- start:272 stop:472 length:201 start_codon:yes stop_codon:yes gene_type:complete
LLPFFSEPSSFLSPTELEGPVPFLAIIDPALSILGSGLMIPPAFGMKVLSNLVMALEGSNVCYIVN